MFYSSESFPLLKVFEENFDQIKGELLSVIERPVVEVYKSTWMQERENMVRTKDNGWKTYTFRFFGIDHLPNLESCPFISRLIKENPFIVTAEFSLLSPDTHILPHKGYTNKLLRGHLGLVVPKGDVRIKVEEIEQAWEEGKILIFDDSELHEAWNRTQEHRIVFMFDFEPTFNVAVSKQICRDVLLSTNDKFIHSIASRDKWLEWLEVGSFPLGGV